MPRLCQSDSTRLIPADKNFRTKSQNLEWPIKTAPNRPVAILYVGLNDDDDDETHFELSQPPVRYQHRVACLACACAEGETEALLQQLAPAQLERPNNLFYNPKSVT